MKYFLRFLLIGWLLTIGQQLLAQTPPSGFTTTTVSAQWNEAVGLTFNKAGTQMFVWERPGRVWMVENGQRQRVLDISEEVGSWRDHGLLGFALHPDFDTNGYIYLMYIVDRHYLMNFGTPAYNPTTNEYFSATIGRITRYQLARSAGGYTVVPGSRTILLGATKTTGIPSTATSHVTGSLVFGADGTLLVSTGDGAHPDPDAGSFSITYYAQALADGIIRPQENVGSFRSQLVDCLNGKILRIDPMTGAGIASNPFYDASKPNAPRSKVWAMGLRNPFRMSLKPGTGSTSPAAGNPGVLYIGDVGYATWEEVSVVDRPGLNMGWPLYEGLTPHDVFITSPTANQDAPNPLYNVNGCGQYFKFQDLLKQATPTGTATFPNPCDPTQSIPASVPTFVQTRPLIDWHHGAGPSRTGIFTGGVASTIDIGAAGSPVAGPQFGGSASVGGVFYPYNDFPAGYQNSYFFADYTGGWVRNLTVDAANKPTAVRDFIGTGAVAVGLAINPTSPGIYYVNFFPSEIRKVTYNSGNGAPTAVASADKRYGPAPLSIQFTGSASTDPGGSTLTYQWDFGDGTTSNQVNPTHVFSPASSAPTGYTVTLTVTNPQGATGQTTLMVSANNTPPQVTITSPANNTLYPLTGQTTYDLRATVTDQEHSAAQLTYAWQTILHHQTHLHPDAIDTRPQTTTTIEPLGCGAETYYYSIELTVTDAAGLSTKQEVRLNPNCSMAPTFAFYRAINLNGAALTLDGNAWADGAAANFITNGVGFVNNTVPLLPATDVARTTMIHSSVYSYALSAAFTAVPAGSYQLYAYVWEDNNPETFSLALNGQPVLSNYNSGPAGTWTRLGPYPVNLAAPGQVALTSSGGAANLSGLELWQQTSGAPPTNRAPVLAAIGNKTATVGQALSFMATASDPDAGQTLTYSLVGAPVGASIVATTGAFSWTPTAAQTGANTFTIRVADSGSPVLTDEEAITVTVSAASGGSTFAFYRAINLNGAALTLDGNAWADGAAANFITNGVGFVNNTVPLLPATDVARTTMIHSSVYSYALSAAFTAVPAGSYQLYAYVWEDNNPETFSLALNGQPVLSNYNSGPAGTWTRLGPYPVNLAAPGQVALTSSGGAANLSGLELWQQTGGPPPPPPPTPPTVLINYGATWKYLDNGTDQAAAWRGAAFDDAAWAAGPGQLGYGDGDEATVVGFGPNAGDKYITTYFRKTFTLANAAAFSTYAASIRRDDGAVVYVNGTEVFRDNLPVGPIDYRTLAALAVDDGNTPLNFSIPATVFRTGANVVAVEIHQTLATSSDISFDLTLSAAAAGARIIAANLPVQSSKTQPVRLYPNPTHDGRFGLVLPEAFEDGASYTLFSALGSKLATGEITPAQAKSDIQLNYSRQMSASGVYYLHVQGKKQNVYLKLLRE